MDDGSQGETGIPGLPECAGTSLVDIVLSMSSVIVEETNYLHFIPLPMKLENNSGPVFIWPCHPDSAVEHKHDVLLIHTWTVCVC